MTKCKGRFDSSPAPRSTKVRPDRVKNTPICTNARIKMLYYRGGHTCLLMSLKQLKPSMKEAIYFYSSYSIFLKLFNSKFELMHFLIPFFKDHHFQSQNYAFAPFHRPQNLTCGTAGRTPVHYITAHKNNISQKSRGLAKVALLQHCTNYSIKPR